MHSVPQPLVESATDRVIAQTRAFLYCYQLGLQDDFCLPLPIPLDLEARARWLQTQLTIHAACVPHTLRPLVAYITCGGSLTTTYARQAQLPLSTLWERHARLQAFVRRHVRDQLTSCAEERCRHSGGTVALQFIQKETHV